MIWWLGWRAAQVTVHTSPSLHSNSCWTDPVSSICCSWPFQAAPIICAVQSRYPAIISKDPCEVQEGLAHLVLALNVVSSIILVMSSDGVLIDKSSGGTLGSLFGIISLRGLRTGSVSVLAVVTHALVSRNDWVWTDPWRWNGRFGVYDVDNAVLVLARRELDKRKCCLEEARVLRMLPCGPTLP